MKVFDFLLVLVLTLVIFLSHTHNYLTAVNIPKLETRYQNSQYVKPDSYTYFIDDPEVYTVAGWHYIHGESPDKVNFEHQPLAKYFIGAGTLLFHNQNIHQLLMVFLCLTMTLMLSTLALPKSLFRFVPVFLLTLDPLFRQQGSLVYLDIYQLAATLLLFLAVLNNRFVLAAVALGLVLLSNSVWAGLVTAFAVFLYFFLKDRKNLLTQAKFIPLTLLIYLLGYVVFLTNNSPVDFVNLHIKQVRFFMSYVPEYPKGEIFRVIFLGLWKKWFGDLGFMPASPWTLFWPLGLVLSFVPLVLRKTSPLVVLFTMWLLVWLLFLSSKLVFPRYLLVILPFMYILATLGVNYIIVGIYGHWHKRQRSKR